MSEVKKTFSVKGMHCASCVRLIEKAVGKLEGVSILWSFIKPNLCFSSYGHKFCISGD